MCVATRGAGRDASMPLPVCLVDVEGAGDVPGHDVVAHGGLSAVGGREMRRGSTCHIQRRLAPRRGGLWGIRVVVHAERGAEAARRGTSGAGLAGGELLLADLCLCILTRLLPDHVSCAHHTTQHGCAAERFHTTNRGAVLWLVRDRSRLTPPEPRQATTRLVAQMMHTTERRSRARSKGLGGGGCRTREVPGRAAFIIVVGGVFSAGGRQAARTTG